MTTETSETGDDRLVWVDDGGNEMMAHDERRHFEAVRISPDGRRASAVVTEGINRSIWLLDLERGGATRLTFGDDDIRPAWSPDEGWVYFTSARRGPYEVFRVRADGSSPAELFREGPPDKTVADVSPDGTLLAYVEDSYDTGYDIVLDPIAGSSEATGFVRTSFWELNPTFSPDGEWIAYQSDDSGRDEVYIRPLSGEGGKTLVSTAGGVSPVWAQSGDRIFYSSSNRIVSVGVSTTPNLELEAAEVFFEANSYRLGEHTRDYDVAPEGDRLLMINTSNPLLRSEITVVLNWFQELNRLVPLPE